MKYEIVTNWKRFRELTDNYGHEWICDLETRGRDPHEPDATLLGAALSSTALFSDTGIEGFYLPFHVNRANTLVPTEVWERHRQDFATFASNKDLINFNIEFDRYWLDEVFGIKTHWIADVRIMLHLQDAPIAQRPYNLEQLQADILGWPESGKAEMHAHLIEQCKKAGIRAGKKGIGAYMWRANLDILGRYAATDAASTREGYDKLSGFFDKHDYWPFLRDIMAYNALLQESTRLGIKVNKEGLINEASRLKQALKCAEARIREVCKGEIGEIEAERREKAAQYDQKRQALFKRKYPTRVYRAKPTKWSQFNPSSDIHLGQLYYNRLKFPVTATTEGGRPKVDKAHLKAMAHPVTEHVLEYNRIEKVLGYVESYLSNLGVDGRLRPSYNICGTVSGRLSGFSPNMQQAPFQELSVMEHFVADEGWLGVHADLVGVEPCITAHFSDDPTLLKVYRDLLGDIYLDLAKELFPQNKELQAEYDPFTLLKPEIKEKFKKVRDIAKVIQLAIQYTGTEYTVSKNLTLKGIPTTVEEAKQHVQRYWRKFRRVREMNWQLQELNRREGHVRNVTGRVIQVPWPDFKDLPNRVIQSSGHDVLRLWVVEIYRLAASRNLPIRPWILDLHDASTNMFPAERIEEGKTVYFDALSNVNQELGLAVPVRCELKVVTSLAGLKGD